MKPTQCENEDESMFGVDLPKPSDEQSPRTGGGERRRQWLQRNEEEKDDDDDDVQITDSFSPIPNEPHRSIFDGTSEMPKTKGAIQKVKDTAYRAQLAKTKGAVQKVKDTAYRAQLAKTKGAVQKVIAAAACTTPPVADTLLDPLYQAALLQHRTNIADLRQAADLDDSQLPTVPTPQMYFVNALLKSRKR